MACHTPKGDSSIKDRLGTVSDLWEPKSAGRAALTYIIAPFLGPSLGPLVGAYIIAEYDNNWRFSIWVILFVAAPVGVGMIFMKETSKSRILYLRSKRRGEKFMVGRAKMSVMRKIGQAVLRPLHMCLFEVCCCPTLFMYILTLWSHLPLCWVSIPASASPWSFLSSAHTVTFIRTSITLTSNK